MNNDIGKKRYETRGVPEDRAVDEQGYVDYLVNVGSTMCDIPKAREDHYVGVAEVILV